MRWILGIDTRDRSQGAIRFAAWLRTHMRDADYEAHGFHVLEHDDMRVLLRRRNLTEVLEQAEASMRNAIEAAEAGDALSTAEVVKATTAEQFLAEAISLHNADGLIIGRSAARDDGSVVRLGRVARRLTRLLPGPVVVVPPDLDSSHLGAGPIVCAIAPTAESLDAAKATVDTAGRLGRDATLIHALRHPESIWPAGSVPKELVEAERQSAQERMTTFCETHGLAEVRREVVLGAAENVLERRGRELQAPLIVCGSRRLSIAQRVFSSSLGTHLACYAKVPVMIVPPR